MLGVGVVLLVTARRLPPAFSDATPVTAASTSAPLSPPPAVTSVPRDPATSPAVAAGTFTPTALSLPAFGVTAAVDPVLTTAGVLAPPDDPAHVGWWEAGAPVAARTGTTIIVGHVDGPAGPGALYRLVHAHPGDHIVVTGSAGFQQVYDVTTLQYHHKGAPLPASLFVATGPPRLVLISCGGTFDRSDDQYKDNVVVVASPV